MTIDLRHAYRERHAAEDLWRATIMEDVRRREAARQCSAAIQAQLAAARRKRSWWWRALARLNPFH